MDVSPSPHRLDQKATIIPSKVSASITLERLWTWLTVAKEMTLFFHLHILIPPLTVLQIILWDRNVRIAHGIRISLSHPSVLGSP